VPVGAPLSPFAPAALNEQTPITRARSFDFEDSRHLEVELAVHRREP